MKKKKKVRILSLNKKKFEMSTERDVAKKRYGYGVLYGERLHYGSFLQSLNQL